LSFRRCLQPTVKTREAIRNRAGNLATWCRKDEASKFENRVNTAKGVYLRIAATLAPSIEPSPD
jgi:hypothetical protein